MLPFESNFCRLSGYLGLGVGVVIGVTAAVVKGSLLAGLMVGPLLGVMVWSIVRRFELRLRRLRRGTKPPAPVSVEERVKPAGGGKRRALVVDDDRMVCRLAKLAIQDMGWEAEWDDNGSSAIVRYRADGPFDVVLVDYMMPGLSGAETVRGIRTVDPGARFVFISGLRPEDMANVDDPDLVFLPKPFDLVQLKAALSKAMQAPA